MPALVGGVTASCGTLPRPAVADHRIEVAVVRRFTVCNTRGGDSRLTLLTDPDAVHHWQAERGVDVFGDSDAGPALPPRAFVMVAYGERSSAGQGITVHRRPI